ncbi:MAG: NAD(P)/FAD-dependent oxidoreductase [Chloroflexi bacterium]|nr:NAD(P)/FAD-dependent oxidoreductase [Chloroflexota bacterium]
MNEGCIPTKTLLRSAEVMHLVRDRSAEFGVRGIDPKSVSFDLAAAVARKDNIVAGIQAGIYKNLDRNKNITFMKGHAEFTSPVDIRIDGKMVTAANSILATGSKPAPYAIPGLKEAGFITNYEALKLEELPNSMIVIGGGYEGVEFAQMYARYGTAVTMLGRAPRVMPKEEPELSEKLGDILREEGVDLHTSTEVVRAGAENGARFVLVREAGSERRYEAEVLLLAVGRNARIENLGLSEAGVEMDGPYVGADRRLRTSASNIWSLGDANGGLMFTHRATYDGPIAALNIVKALGREVDYRVVPRAVFTEPTLASVGLTEAEARAQGHEVRVGTADFAGSGRAKAIGLPVGMVKLIADDGTGELLGGHILGPRADDLIHEVVTAMYKKGSAEAIAKSIHVHPTLSEVVKRAAKALR